MANANNTPESPLPATASGQFTEQDALTPKQRRIRKIAWRTAKITPRTTSQPKAERFVTVSLCPGEIPAMPWIRLRGQWLLQAGFDVQAKVRIKIEQGRLILTPEPTSAAP